MHKQLCKCCHSPFQNSTVDALFKLLSNSKEKKNCGVGRREGVLRILRIIYLTIKDDFIDICEAKQSENCQTWCICFVRNWVSMVWRIILHTCRAVQTLQIAVTVAQEVPC